MIFRTTIVAMLGMLIILQVESSVRDAQSQAVLLDRVSKPTRFVSPPVKTRTRVVPQLSWTDDTIITDVNRAELFRQLEEPAFAKSARFVPAVRHGHASGIKIYAIQPGSLVQALGLQNGDTLLSINDTPMTSPGAAFQVYDGLEDSPDFLDMSVRRNGRQIRIVALLHS